MGVGAKNHRVSLLHGLSHPAEWGAAPRGGLVQRSPSRIDGSRCQLLDLARSLLEADCKAYLLKDLVVRFVAIEGVSLYTSPIEPFLRVILKALVDEIEAYGSYGKLPIDLVESAVDVLQELLL